VCYNITECKGRQSIKKPVIIHIQTGVQQGGSCTCNYSTLIQQLLNTHTHVCFR